MRALCLLLLLSACKRDDVDTGDTGVSDTDTTVVYEHGFHGFARKADDVSRPGDLRVALVRVVDATAWEVDLTLASTELGGTGVFRIDLLPEGPPAEHLGPLDAEAHPGLEGALYLPVVHVDDDRDELYLAGEATVGLHRSSWLVWSAGELPAGWPEGWSLVDLHLADAGEPTFEPLSTEVEIHLVGLEAELTLAGGWAEAAETPGLGLAGVDHHLVLSGKGDDFPVLDAALDTGVFEVDLVQRPPGEHWFTHGATGLRYALDANLVYEDLDEDDSWSEGDALTGTTTCHDGAPVYDRYLAAPSTVAEAAILDLLGWQAGWRAVQLDGSDVPSVELGSAEARALSLDPEGCVLDLAR